MSLIGKVIASNTWINRCSLAHSDPLRQEQEKYAHRIRYRLKNGLATQFEIKADLNKRSDKEEIRQILEELRDERTR